MSGNNVYLFSPINALCAVGGIGTYPSYLGIKARYTSDKLNVILLNNVLISV